MASMYEDFKAFLTTKVKEELDEKWEKKWKKNEEKWEKIEEKHRNELQQKDDTIQALRHEIAELCKKNKVQ